MLNHWRFRRSLQRKGFARVALWHVLLDFRSPQHRLACSHNLMREAARKERTGIDLQHLMSRFNSWLEIYGLLSHRRLGGFCQTERPFLKAQSGPRIPPTDHAVNVTQLRDFAQYYLGLSASASGTLSSEVAIRAEMASVLSLLGNKRAFEQEVAKRGLSISGRNGFFWLGPGGVDEHSRPGGAGGPPAAEVVRNILGLAHFDSSRGEVISLRIESTNLPSPRTPTTFDACAYPFFRPALRGDGWGETINLADGGDGAPEAIHADTRIREGVQAVVLGKLDKGRVGFTTGSWARLLRESERELAEWCKRGNGKVEV